MSSQYAGSNVYPVDFTIPDDGDPRTATSINVALEALGDRTTYLAGHSPRIKILEFLASGTFTPGPRVVAGLALGCGGGGGGGAGADDPGGVDLWQAGGAGGGGSLYRMHPIVLVPGSVHNVDVGAGGLGALTDGLDGDPGGASIVRLVAANLAIFPGASGGEGARGGAVAGLWEHYTQGGVPVYASEVRVRIGPTGVNIRYDTSDAMWAVTSLSLGFPVGSGGFGADGSGHPLSSIGSRNDFGTFAGGAPGTRGADDGTDRGGGGGGGGAAGPFGVGGPGGEGGIANATNGKAGTAAAANTGAGGGGSGSKGSGSGGLDTVVGGNGGSGRVYIVLVEDTV